MTSKFQNSDVSYSENKYNFICGLFYMHLRFNVVVYLTNNRIFKKMINKSAFQILLTAGI